MKNTSKKNTEKTKKSNILIGCLMLFVTLFSSCSKDDDCQTYDHYEDCCQIDDCESDESCECCCHLDDGDIYGTGDILDDEIEPEDED